jgi:hypothetical protein
LSSSGVCDHLNTRITAGQDVPASTGSNDVDRLSYWTPAVEFRGGTAAEQRSTAPTKRSMYDLIDHKPIQSGRDCTAIGTPIADLDRAGGETDNGPWLRIDGRSRRLVRVSECLRGWLA